MMLKANANESNVVLTDGNKTENFRKRMTDYRRETYCEFISMGMS